MSPSARWLIPLCLASVLWAFSFGLNAQLASLWMHDAGSSDTVVGLNTAVYYLGIAGAAGVVPLLMRRWGYGALVVGVTATGLTAAAFPWGGSLVGWFVCRLLNGFAAAVSLIPLETYVNHTSSPDRRAQNFGYYAFSVALGMALGTVAGTEAQPEARPLFFVLAGVAAILGGFVVLAWRPQFASATEESHGREPLDFGRNFLSFGSAWSQGFMEGGMVGLLSIYLLAVGLSKETAGILIGGVMIGVILAQVPVAFLADRLGRTAVLAGCTVVTLTGVGCLMIPVGTTWLALWLFVVGACSGAFYPLGLALLGERVPPSGLARANAWYLGINCVGSVTGPAVAGAAMDLFGRRALFPVGGIAVGLVLFGWLALESRRRRAARKLAEVASQEKESSRRAA